MFLIWVHVQKVGVLTKKNHEDSQRYHEEQIKFLGIILVINLEWNEHVIAILTNINSRIYALYKMSSLGSNNTMEKIYFSFIHSHIIYGIYLYGS